MKANIDRPRAPESKPAARPEARLGSKPDANNDLRSMPMPEVKEKLGSSPDGLSQAEAQKRLAQYGPNEIEKKILDRLRAAKQHEEEQQQADERVREDAAEKSRSEGRAAGRT